MGQERLAEVGSTGTSPSVRWWSSVDEASPGGDLCIVATQAAARCPVVREVVEELGYRAYLLEKWVAQSLRDYETLMNFADTMDLSVWVNLKTRAHASHKRAKTRLSPGEPIVLTVVGGNQGLANNGIHAADLFLFYDGSDRIDPVATWIDPVLHSSKRGPDVFDLSGTILGCSPRGSRLFLSFAGDHNAPGYFTVTSRRYRAVIDDMSKLLCESETGADWAWNQVPFEDNLMVSYMTRAIAAGILTTGRSELPTLAQAFPAHRFLFETLGPHFRKLLGTDSDCCPVV